MVGGREFYLVWEELWVEWLDEMMKIGYV